MHTQTSSAGNVGGASGAGGGGAVGGASSAGCAGAGGAGGGGGLGDAGPAQDFMVGDVSVTVLLPAGLPAVAHMTLGFKIETREQLRQTVERFGGIERFAKPTDDRGLLSIYGRGSEVSVHLHLKGDEFESSRPSRHPAIAELFAGGQDG